MEQQKIDKPVGKTDADIAVDGFNEAHTKVKELLAKIESGEFIPELITMSQGSMDAMKAGWKQLFTQTREAIEQYNVKRREVSDAIRQQVMLAPTQWRGPEGKPTQVKVGAFAGASITKRSFDPESLFKAAKSHGLLERIMELKAWNADGKEYNVVQQEWEIDYTVLHNWLRERGLDDIIKIAYNEKESTPQIRGPKELYFLGDEKKS